MTTPQPTSTREADINPNVLLGVLLTAILAASIMGFFHLDAKIDTHFSTFDAKTDTRFSALDAKTDTRFSALDAKIDTRFSALDTKIDTRIGEVSAEIRELKDLIIQGLASDPVTAQ